MYEKHSVNFFWSATISSAGATILKKNIFIKKCVKFRTYWKLAKNHEFFEKSRYTSTFCADKPLLNQTSTFEFIYFSNKIFNFQPKIITFFRKLIFLNIVSPAEDIVVDQPKFNRGFFIYRPVFLSLPKDRNQKKLIFGQPYWLSSFKSHNEK